MKLSSHTNTSLYGVVACLTLACLAVLGFAYVAVQQNYRQSANDPQIQVAADTATLLSAGQTPQAVVDTKRIVDPSKSLAAFVTVVGQNGDVQASNAQLNGTTPVPPKAVLVAADHDQNRLTWQPQSDARIALVVQHFSQDKLSGYVLVGRSLKEIENRESRLFWMAVAAGLVVLTLGAGAALLVYRTR